LSRNRLTRVPPALARLPHLEDLELSENPIRTPPPEILAKGENAVLSFLRDIAVESTIRRTARVLLVGNSRTDKTRLRHALCGILPDRPSPEFHDIVVTSCQVPHPNRSHETLTLNLWDFGREQIDQRTCRFFMTPRSLYLVTWNACDAEFASLETWFRMVQGFAPGAPMLIVTMRSGDKPAPEFYDRLKATFPDVVGYVEIDSQEFSEINQLRLEIARHAAALPLIDQEWPQNWVTVEARLQQQCGAYITLDRYLEICHEHGISADIATTVLGRYFHDLGLMLYYHDDYVLRTLLVLDPNWLIHAMRWLLNDDIIRQRQGILAHTDLEDIWQADEDGTPYQPGCYPWLLHVLHRFGLGFPLAADNLTGESTHTLIPQLLSEILAERLLAWQTRLSGHPEITMIFHLENACPPELMPRIIVQTYPYTTGIHWKNGVLLHDDDHDASIVIDSNALKIWVTGPFPSTFATILQHILDRRVLRSLFSRRAYRCEIPCCCHKHRDVPEPCPYVYAYEDLLERRRRHQNSIECGHSFERVSITQMLEGLDDSEMLNQHVNAELQDLQDTIRQLVSQTSGNDSVMKGIEQLNQTIKSFKYALMAKFARH
jgi:hypothetical protein